MKKKSMSDIKQREIWVDNVKGIACVLVVLGHFSEYDKSEYFACE